MKWRKLGRLFTPVSSHEKLVSHASNPVAIPMDGDVYRIFYSGRDHANRSSVGWADIDIVSQKVIQAPQKPAFTYGGMDTYYYRGVSIGCWYDIGLTRYLLFMGWQHPEGGHWRGDIGRLRLSDDHGLTADGSFPFIGESPEDPVSLSYPWVMRTADHYLMWYGSTVTWDAGNGEMLHVIKGARSSDGDRWELTGQAIPHQIGIAQAFSRPTVRQRKDGSFDMWFSYRGAPGRTYRIGHAFSRDGHDWELQLDSGSMDVSEEKWDSQMTCYPFVFQHSEKTYMLYNGNGYGLTGFGLAVLDE